MPPNKRPSSDLAVITKAKELCDYVITVTQKSPKQFRFTLVTRMQNLAWEVVEQLFRANQVFVAKGDTAAAARRLELQHQASTSLQLLVFAAEMAQRHGCLLMKQYEQISCQAFDVGNLIGGWINSDKKRFSPGLSQA